MKRFLPIGAIIVFLSLLIPGQSLALSSNDPFVYQLSYEQVGVYRAWDYSLGSPKVVVAVIDNGFDTFHPDLVGNVWKNINEISNDKIDNDHNGFTDDVWGWNFLDKNNNPQPVVTALSDLEKNEELYNHGTFVAGIIGAIGNNGRDGAGVAWNVKLMNLKVLGNDGYGNFMPTVDAIHYAVDNGADIINVSMAGDYSPEIIKAVDYAYSKGVVVVAAMGNYNGSADEQPQYPACADAGSMETHVLGVSSINEDRRLANFSNTGSKCVDITAPGVRINSISRYAPESGITESYKKGWQGTSFSAPFVTGAAVLIKSVQPNWKAPQIYQAILSTTHHTPAEDEVDYARLYGKGLLQVHRAVAYAMGLPVPPSLFPGSVDVVAPIIPSSTPSLIETKPLHTKTFIAVGAVGQIRDAYSDSFELGGQYERPEATNIESATTFGTGAEQIIATVRVGAKNVRVVSIYNNKWQLQNSWNSNFTVPVQVVIGKRSGQVVIALAPTQSNKIVYQIYSDQGEQLEEKINLIVHKGVHLAFAGENILTVYTTNQQTNFVSYKLTGEIEKEFVVTQMGVNPYLASGDVSGNGRSNIVIGSGVGVTDLVRVYDETGLEQRSFSPFGDGRRNGVSVIVVDADNNGTQDLLTYSANPSADGAGPIRAWTARAKPAGEWDAPFIGSFFLLPR